jgi:hypothetical protein
MTLAELDRQQWPGTVVVAEFLASAEGRAVVKRALSRYRLSSQLHDDLVSEVTIASLRMDAKGELVETPAAFVTHVARQRAIDMVRKERRTNSRFMAQSKADDVDLLDAVGEADPNYAGIDDLGQFDQLRAAIVPRTTALAPWVLSATLTYLAVRAELCEPGAACRRPVAGTTGHRAAQWAGLWYAGQGSLMPAADGTDPPANRKARSRAMIKLDEVLAEACARRFEEPGNE